MKKKAKKRPEPADALRARAEARLARRTRGPVQRARADTARLVHELQVHEVELEMQNEELRQARAEVETLLARYTDLYDFAPVGYVTFDRDGAIRDANLTAARLLGVERSRLLNRRLGEFVAGTDSGGFGDFVHEVFASETRQCWECTLPQAGLQPVVLRIEAARAAGGMECRAVVLDVTDRRRSEAQLRQFQKLEAIGRLAGGIAHDFNNLLAVITGNGDLARRKLGPEHPVCGRIDQIMTAAERAAGLTRQLLAFGRQRMLQPKPLDLNAIVADVERMLERLIGEDIAIVVRPAPGLGTVTADPDQIAQIILNLAVNARDAMPRGGSLTIETANVVLDAGNAVDYPPAAPGRYTMLLVSDTGIGMDEETRQRIFEPFFTTKQEGAGTGLGLATVYGIVGQSGGHISVESQRDRGTTFKVYLPRTDAPVARAAAANPSQPAPGGHETILLAEDTEMLRSVIRDTLAESGYTVLPASNGEEALALAQASTARIDLLLTDVVMPHVGGRDLAQRLSALRPGLRVLYMSGYTKSAVEPGSLLLEKPFTADQLLRRVREVLDRPR